MRKHFVIVLALFVGGWSTLGRTATAAPSTQPNKTSNPTVAVFKLDRDLSESGGGSGGLSALFGEPPVTLHELIDHMNKAAADPNVKAVVLLREGGALGSAQLEEIRQAMSKLQTAGKPLYVHSDSMIMGEYSLFSGATRISVVPTADLWVTGFFGEQPYVRGLLDKLGVKPDFLHCGAYKSASELFMREGPSPEADAMMNWLYDGIYDTHVNLIAKGRKVDPSKAKQWIDEGPYTAEKAKEKGLIDAIEHRQDFEGMLREKYGKDVAFDKKYGEPKEPEVDLSSPFALFKILGELMNGPQKKAPSKPAVGIVFVEGAIELGNGGEPSPLSPSGEGAFSSKIRKALDEAANDDNVKAVVLRVDSPGGSAVASEIILDATKRVKAKKPFVVSMGNVAGSGGYYVTCASDTVFADESTITASIGVVGGKFATNDMWKKVGITFKAYQRGKASGLMSSASTWSDDERARMQGWMDDVYTVFKKHVTDARGDRLKKPIDELAAGRVFTGKQALELGLVDRIGTLNDAIEYIASAAKLGNVGDYDVRPVPEPKNFIEQIFENAKGDPDPSHVAIGLFASRLSAGGSLADLAMPYLQHLDPHRVTQIRAALRTLDLMQREGVILTTPELMIWDQK